MELLETNQCVQAYIKIVIRQIRLRYVTWRYLIIYSKSRLDCALLSSVYYFLSNALSVTSVMANMANDTHCINYYVANTMLTITLSYRYNGRKYRADGEPPCRSSRPRPVTRPIRRGERGSYSSLPLSSLPPFSSLPFPPLPFHSFPFLPLPSL